MALRFLDSFDHYVTADLTEKWTTRLNGPAISAGNGRRGTASLRITGNSDRVRRLLDAQATWIIGVAVKAATLPGTWPLLALMDGASYQDELRINSSGQLVHTRANTTLGTSSFTLTAGQWYYIEWKVTIHNTAGAYEVKVDGVSRLSGSSVDTQATANASADIVEIGNNSATTVTVDVDDCYVCDTSGSECNDFLGEVRVDALLPAGSGTVSTFSPSSAGATAVSMTQQTSPDDNTTYMYASAAGAQLRLVMSALVSQGGSIYGVQLALSLAKSDVTNKTIAPLFLTSATSAQQVSTTLTTTSYVYVLLATSQNASGVSWTDSLLSSAEFGLEVIA